MCSQPDARHELLDIVRDRARGQGVLNLVRTLASQVGDRLGRPPVFMEVCGTHTAAMAAYGLRSLLKGVVELKSGPGCPVCVTPREDIDHVLALAELPGITIATFGDLLRVPGSFSSLEKERARGAQVQIIYSPIQALKFAAAQPQREVVLLGIGFETTAPLAALSLLEAQRQQLNNFSVLSLHKLIPPALHALLAYPEQKIDGFILPGHVATIIGARSFDFLARDYQLPAAVTGFEPVDILLGLHSLLQSLQSNNPQVTNMYPRAVTGAGNIRAQQLMRECFLVTAATWRGLGLIPASGLKLRGKWQDYDAACKFPLAVASTPDPPGCACGYILQGLLNPPECPLFAHACTPRNPVGPCMVSGEGACAAYFRYQGHQEVLYHER